jgi:hypothetical protein
VGRSSSGPWTTGQRATDSSSTIRSSLLGDLVTIRTSTVSPSPPSLETLGLTVRTAGSSATAKFRTINEFAPHLHWLLSNGPGSPTTCLCKYCTGRLQGQVNSVLGLESGHSTPRAPRPQKPRMDPRPPKKIKLTDDSPRKEKTAGVAGPSNEGGAATNVKRAKKSGTPPYSGSYTSRERDNDLSDGALYRRGELVWIALDKPFEGVVGEDQLRLAWWPAIITDRTVKTNSVRTAPLEDDQPPELENVHSHLYSARLLSCADEISRTEDQIRPFLGMASTEEIITSAEQITAQESVKLVWNGQACLRPLLSQMKDVATAATPFALALQIAAHINAFFCFE